MTFKSTSIDISIQGKNSVFALGFDLLDDTQTVVASTTVSTKYRLESYLYPDEKHRRSGLSASPSGLVQHLENPTESLGLLRQIRS